MSDEELVKKAKTGDQRAFEVLVHKYQQRLFALISRYVRDQDEVQDVAQEALSEELEAVIHAAINELPQELKTAVTLREFEGLSYEDIAVVMECPVGTVRSRIFRAREAIDTAVRPLLGSQRGDKG